MKKLLLIAPIVALGGFMSCKKCQTCTTSVTQNVGGIGIPVNTSEQYCGDEYDNAPAETTVEQVVGGVSQTVSINCVDD